jgi:hypothetical protein
MFLFPWQRWFHRHGKANAGHGRRRRASFRPRLEVLENRLAPAALTLKVTTTLDELNAMRSQTEFWERD